MIGSNAPYDLGRSPGVCAATGRAFEVGERFVATLALDPSGDLRREDFAAHAWEGGARPAGRLFASWRTAARAGDDRARPLLDDDELMDLFERPGGDGEDQLAFRYLLALHLIRRKKLVYEGGRAPTRGGAGVMLVRARTNAAERAKAGDAPLIEVIDPGLGDDRIAALAEQLGAIMNLDDGPGS